MNEPNDHLKMERESEKGLSETSNNNTTSTTTGAALGDEEDKREKQDPPARTMTGWKV